MLKYIKVSGALKENVGRALLTPRRRRGSLNIVGEDRAPSIAPNPPDGLCLSLHARCDKRACQDEGSDWWQMAHTSQSGTH